MFFCFNLKIIEMEVKECFDTRTKTINQAELLSQLNAALSEEWLATYQYWVGALIAVGVNRGDVQRELQEHAAEEQAHANLLAKRIVELGGDPVYEPCSTIS